VRNLYRVQDDDRPMFVFSSSWQGAVAAWKEMIHQENPDCSGEEEGWDEPQGITLVAKGDELLLHAED